MCTHYFSDDMLWWYFKQEWKNNWDRSHLNQFQMTASTVLIQQVPFSFSRYRSLAYISMSRYLLFKFALPFSLARTYKRLVQPYQCLLRLCWYSYGSLFRIPKRFYALFYPCARSVDASFARCRLNRRKLNTYRETRLPSWENGTWQVPSQLSHSASLFVRPVVLTCLELFTYICCAISAMACFDCLTLPLTAGFVTQQTRSIDCVKKLLNSVATPVVSASSDRASMTLSRCFFDWASFITEIIFGRSSVDHLYLLW